MVDRKVLNAILDEYRALQGEMDRWFASCMERFGTRIACGEGCSECCRGLFDISLLDAALLQRGVARLAPEIRRRVEIRAQEVVERIRRRRPGFVYPYLLNALPDALWEIPEEDDTVCPLLGEDGRCLIYAERPQTCRLHGLPQVDLSGEVFSDRVCTRNFPGEDAMELAGLRWSFRSGYAREFDIYGRFALRLLGERRLELDTFIPAALFIDFDHPEGW